MSSSRKNRLERENDCKTKGLGSSITLRLPAAVKIHWQARADGLNTDLGALIRDTMENEKNRSAAQVKNDNQRHLQRMALWSVQCLIDLRGKVDRSTMIDAQLADEIALYLMTLLALFSAVSDGEIQVSLSPDASEDQMGGL